MLFDAAIISPLDAAIIFASVDITLLPASAISPYAMMPLCLMTLFR